MSHLSYGFPWAVSAAHLRGHRSHPPCCCRDCTLEETVAPRTPQSGQACGPTRRPGTVPQNPPSHALSPPFPTTSARSPPTRPVPLQALTRGGTGRHGCLVRPARARPCGWAVLADTSSTHSLALSSSSTASTCTSGSLPAAGSTNRSDCGRACRVLAGVRRSRFFQLRERHPPELPVSRATTRMGHWPLRARRGQPVLPGSLPPCASGAGSPAVHDRPGTPGLANGVGVRPGRARRSRVGWIAGRRSRTDLRGAM